MNFIRKILLKRTLNKVAKEVIAQLKNDIATGARFPHIASGELLDSFAFKIEENGTQLSLQLVANESYEFIEDGRKAGAFVPVAPLERWMEAKGIPLEFSYPINLAIKRDGIAPKKYLQTYLTTSEDASMKKLAKALQGDLEDALAKQLKTIK